MQLFGWNYIYPIESDVIFSPQYTRWFKEDETDLRTFTGNGQIMSLDLDHQLQKSGLVSCFCFSYSIKSMKHEINNQTIVYVL